MTGIVKWFSSQKGYGFITPKDGGKDVFVHFSGVVGDGYKSLKEGDLVEFELIDGPKGQQAGKVCVEGNVIKSDVPSAQAGEATELDDNDNEEEKDAVSAPKNGARKGRK